MIINVRNKDAVFKVKLWWTWNWITSDSYRTNNCMSECWENIETAQHIYTVIKWHNSHFTCYSRQVSTTATHSANAVAVPEIIIMMQLGQKRRQTWCSLWWSTKFKFPQFANRSYYYYYYYYYHWNCKGKNEYLCFSYHFICDYTDSVLCHNFFFFITVWTAVWTAGYSELCSRLYVAQCSVLICRPFRFPTYSSMICRILVCMLMLSDL